MAVGKDDTTGFLVFALGLVAVSGGINEIPVLGGHVSSILGNVSALVNAAAVVVVIRCVVSMTGLGGGGDGEVVGLTQLSHSGEDGVLADPGRSRQDY